MKDSEEERQFIRNYVEPETTVYHKAGWLADRAHDTAIIENGDRPLVLVIFTKKRFGPYDFDKGQKVFQQLTSASMEVFRSI
jgi:beta-lactamase class A